MTITIPASYDGRMLRSYLKLTLGLSTAVLAKLKNREDGILVNGRRVTVRYILRAGDVLTLGDRDTPETATEHVIPVDLPLNILYEDAYLLALSKPAGMPTHPSHGHLTDTLANALAYRYRQAAEPFVFRPLGRLDRNTSGVVVMGKTRAAAGFLSRTLIAGEVQKRYMAVLTGEFDPSAHIDTPKAGFADNDPLATALTREGDVYTLRAPIYRPDAAGIRRAVGNADTPGAVAAVTRFRLLATGNGHTLVLCEPVTGRTHQLRVHFAHLGHPLAGDDIYGTTSSLIGRQALHALSLTFPLPFGESVDGASTQTIPTGTAHSLVCDGRLRVTAPLPVDMATLVATLFPAEADCLHTVGHLTL